MRTIPSQRRTERILQLCADRKLSDPFRCLHLEERDYTYIPSGVLRSNRSRIDFFLISDDILAEVKTCTIADAICRKSFDHKAIFLTFAKCKSRGRNVMNNTVLDNPLIDCSVRLAIWEKYLEHIVVVPGGITAATYQEDCNNLQLIDNMYCTLLSLQGKAVTQDLTEEELAEQDELTNRLARGWDRVSTYDYIQRQPRNVDDDLFFEELIIITNKATMNLQNLSRKAENVYKNKLLANLAELRASGGLLRNREEIVEIERNLNAIEEKINRDKVDNYLKHEILNNEKITPRFLRLAKTINTDSLGKIRDSNGRIFQSKRERGEFITDFYRQLYKVPDSMPADFTGCIENFLGRDICNHPTVLGSKLSDEERAVNELPLDITELDESVSNLNLKSAPGIDGVRNKFIAKFWHLLREPLYRYALCCIRKGRLTDTFSTALIRLIPKKGETTMLKNWRPISLLSCYYKIISKALNVRLGKVIDKVTSSAQKAYNSERFIHEAVINTIETIQHCKNLDVDGLLLSVDLHKAFDSVFHGFMREVYRFFGFGDNFIKLSETLGNNRTARVILEDGIFSDPIQLERCRPQGDSPSPRQFNMCQQICIFKIELDPNIKSVYLSFVVPRPRGQLLELRPELVPDLAREEAVRAGYRLSDELTTTKKKVSSFADDLTAALKSEPDTVRLVKVALEQFGTISGLRTNVEKFTMMRIGRCTRDLDPAVARIGFPLVGKMKLLGFEISNDINELHNNFDSCLAKMRQIVGNWSRFRLTLPGRIGIAKTMLLSQVAYHGAILNPTVQQLNEMSAIIENFVTAGVVISKNRNLPVKEGGLGLIKLESFLHAQKCVWVKRCVHKINDAWRWEILERTNFCLDSFRLECFDKEKNPMLWNIAESVCKFQDKYWVRNENYRTAPIFNNTFFLKEEPRRRGQDPGRIGTGLLRQELRNEFKNEILAIKMECMFNNDQLADYGTVCTNFGIPFSQNEYMMLRTAASFAMLKYGNKDNSNGKSRGLMDGIYAKKSRARIFRLYLDNSGSGSEINQLRTVKTFFELISLEVPEKMVCSELNSIWSLQSLPNGIRTFCFQFVNNSLPTGPRLAGRYRANPEIIIDKRCVFCVKDDVGVPARETFCHLFFDCECVKKCVTAYLNKYGNVN
jgi:hypothetical protein